ncbi:MAG: type II toxin-antitoxin system VapC family toxin [Chloroflexi bacterium]|nr:type II toxin-antitoxin system VapC family toxin [Chloroflexota bacterium]
MKLLDTDHCIAILRRKLDLREHISPDEQLATTAISVAEMTHGANRSLRKDENLASLDILLSSMLILSFDEAAGRKFGNLKAELEANGEILDDLDLQIASIALENKTPLITNNTRHFSRIDQLQLQNWLH